MSAILPKDGLHELHAGTAGGEQVSIDADLGDRGPEVDPVEEQPGVGARKGLTDADGGDLQLTAGGRHDDDALGLGGGDDRRGGGGRAVAKPSRRESEGADGEYDKDGEAD